MDTDRQYTILIVDDNPALLQLLSLGLPDMGNFQVVTAEDGVDGLNKFYELSPDCMVIDVMMPELDGYQLVRALRGDPESALTPIIMLTALAQDRNKFAGLAAGVDQYLTKPVMTSELAAAIHRAIELADTERQRLYQSLVDVELPEESGDPS